MIFAVFFAGAYLLINKIVNDLFREWGKEISVLKDALKEKRVQLKNDDNNLILPDQKTLNEVKGKLGHITERLQVQLNDRKLQDNEINRICEHYHDLINTHSGEGNARRKEIDVINSNYTIIVQNTTKHLPSQIIFHFGQKRF
jgi:translation initiation factor 2 alpha subunit (eIF-2alpha)